MMFRVGLPPGAVWSVLVLSLSACGSPPAAESPAPPPPLDEPATSAAAPVQKAPAAAAPSNALVKEGMAAIESRDFARAKQVLREAAAKDPKDAQAAFYLGVALEGEGDAKGAIAQYEKALELDPKLADASANLAAAFYDQKDYARALATADRGLKAAPKSPELLVNRALSLEALGRKDELLAAYAAAVKAKPDDAALRLTYAEYLAGAGQNDAALAELRSVTVADDPTLLAALGVRFGRLKAYPDCIAALDRAIKLKDAPDLHVRRGVCRHDFGDDPGAIADFEGALALDAKFAPAHYYLGKHFEKTDKKKALRHFEEASKLDPTGPVGKKSKQEAEDLRKQR